MSYDGIAQEQGFCGHICPTEGPAFGYVCTRASGHDAPLHQVVQLIGPEEFLGHINAAWLEDGTVTLFDPAPMVCPLKASKLPPEDLARVDQRIAVVSTMVDQMVTDYRRQGTADSSMAVFQFNLALMQGYSQAPTADEGLKRACEALAVAVKKLAETDEPAK